MTLDQTFSLLAGLVGIVALLVSLDWLHARRHRSPEDTRPDERAATLAQIAKLTQAPPRWDDASARRQRMADGTRPAVKGIEAQRHGRRPS